MVRAKNKHHKAADYMEWSQAMQLIEKLINDNERVFALYLSIGFFCALRNSDIIVLRYSDFDLEKKQLCVIEQKTKKERLITLNDNFIVIFRRCYPENLYDVDAPIFRHGEGVYTLQNMNQRLKTLKRKYSLDIENISSHFMRKTMSRHVWDTMGRSDEALILLGCVLKHSNISITRRYLGLSDAEISQVYVNL